MKTETQPSLEQMRVEVLEWMGWDFNPIEAQGWKSQQDNHCWCKNPDTCELVIKFGTGFPALTLDWLHECEKKLNEKQRITFLMRLSQPRKECIPLDPSYAEEQWVLVHATATQRLLALYKTIHKNRRTIKGL